MRRFATYWWLYTFSAAAPSTGVLLRKSVSFSVLTAMCCFAVSKCANRSNPLVSLPLYCSLHLFLLISYFRAWWPVYRNTFVVSHLNEIGIFWKPRELPIFLTFQLSSVFGIIWKSTPERHWLYLPSDCFCHPIVFAAVLFRDRFCLHLLLRCYLCLCKARLCG